MTTPFWMTKLEHASREMADALDRARTAIFDAHYGNGIDVNYVRAVDTWIANALATFSAAEQDKESSDG